jgi:hypothetical protein
MLLGRAGNGLVAGQGRAGMVAGQVSTWWHGWAVWHVRAGHGGKAGGRDRQSGAWQGKAG